MSGLTERLRAAWAKMEFWTTKPELDDPCLVTVATLNLIPEAADTIDALAEALRAFLTAFDADQHYFGDECEAARAALAKAGL